MANRAEQKAAARAAREARQQRLSAAQTRRKRLIWLGSIVLAVVVALVVVAVTTSGGSGTKKTAPTTAIASVRKLIDGIPQSGNTLGEPAAPVTVTEYADLVCSTCDAFALTSEEQLIQAEVRTGHAKLVFRGLETASSFANGGQYVNTQVAIRSAGLQNRAWYYILLAYEEQPANSENVSYITSNYLQNLAAQVPGLDLIKWQAAMTSPPLLNDVMADSQAAHAAGVTGTPAIIVSGAQGSVFYDKNQDPSVSAVPSLATLQQLMTQVS